MIWGRFAVGLAIADLAVLVLAALLNPAPDIATSVLYLIGVATYVGTGALLAHRVPAKPIWALMLLTGTLGVVSAATITYAEVGAMQVPPWPGAAAAGTIGETMFIYPILVALVGIPLVFPDGRLPSRGFRWVVVLTLAGMIGWFLGSIFDIRADLVVLIAVPVAFGGAVSAVALRFRRGDAIQREQVKWLAAVVSIGAAAVLSGLFLSELVPDLATALLVVGVIALFSLPFVIGLAILRYRLYEIDRIISRTLSYLLITAVLVASYAVLVVIIGGPLADVTGGDTLSVALSTLAVAALFQPLRRRVQALVDRRFDRARYDGQRLTEAFAGRLRDDVDIASVTADLDATVRAAVRPARTVLWVRERR